MIFRGLWRKSSLHVRMPRNKALSLIGQYHVISHENLPVPQSDMNIYKANRRVYNRSL